MYKVTTYYKENPEAINNICKKSTYYWTEHLYYTRQAIVSILAGLPDVAAISARLLKNQEDIGALLAPYYSSEQVDAFVALLKKHVALAAEYITAVKDKADLVDVKAKLTDNGNDIVNWMAMVDPTDWPASKMSPLWTDHLTQTINQVESRTQGDWVADIVALDAGHQCIDQLAQEFGWGIVYNNIQRFSISAI